MSRKYGPNQLSQRVNAAIAHSGLKVPQLISKARTLGYSISDATFYNSMNGVIGNLSPVSAWIISRATGVDIGEIEPDFAHTRQDAWRVALDYQARHRLNDTQMSKLLGMGPLTYKQILAGKDAPPSLLERVRQQLGGNGIALDPEKPLVTYVPLNPQTDDSKGAEQAFYEAPNDSPEPEPPAPPEPVDARAPAEEMHDLNDVHPPQDDPLKQEAVPEPEPEQYSPAGPTPEDQHAVVHWALVQALSGILDLIDAQGEGRSWTVTTLLCRALYTVVQQRANWPLAREILRGLEILTDPQANVGAHSLELFRLMMRLVNKREDEFSSSEEDLYTAFLAAAQDREELR